MTDKTTHIWVELTENDMDQHEAVEWSFGANARLAEAIKAQRPRPIAVGDRVTAGGNYVDRYTVEGIKDGYAWLWSNGGPWGHYSLTSLTRVDDEAAT